jgi:transcriptional regulator with XRE-family HTH domain
LFGVFRKNVKKVLYNKKLTYSQLSDMAGLAESTIKCFMCGATDSRRTAERIADALNCELVYSNGIYLINEKEDK